MFKYITLIFIALVLQASARFTYSNVDELSLGQLC